MKRRYAILDDNQTILAEKLSELGRLLPALLAPRICAALVIGSVAAGQAHDVSDVDLLLILDRGSPRRSDYDWWEAVVSPRLGVLAGRPFAVQPVIVGRDALHTTEPHLRQALRAGIPVWDPKGLFDDQSEARP